MCLIFTSVVAAVFSILFFLFDFKKRRISSFRTVALISWGAAIMWCVDGFANLIGGEPFFDFTKEDAVLGAIVVASILLIFAALEVFKFAKVKFFSK